MPPSPPRARRTHRHAALAALAALALLGSSPAPAQQRAQPVTGPGVSTIGNIPTNGLLDLRSGPGSAFPSLGKIRYGTRVRPGECISLGTSRWCRVTALDSGRSGFVSAGFIVTGASAPGGDALDGGPDFWAVRGLGRGDRLGVRRDPSGKSPALATLAEGEVVRNLGCRMTGSTRWCRIRSTTGMDVTGWVQGSYLREAPPPRPGGGAAKPERWVVSGLAPGDTLNLRAEPSASARVLATLQPGVRVERLDCRDADGGRWCQIRTTGAVAVTGWVNRRYLSRG